MTQQFIQDLPIRGSFSNEIEDMALAVTSFEELMEPKTKTYKVTIDMREMAETMKIYLGDVGIEPHVNMKMSLDTFDALCEKTICGFMALMKGKLKFSGSLAIIKKWDREVATKYLNNLDENVCFLD